MKVTPQQINYNHIINYDLRTKLKPKFFLIKGPGIKINNKKYKDLNWKNQKKKGHTCTFSRRQKKMKKKEKDHQWQTIHHLPSCQQEKDTVML
jgi:hypothetical protein